MKSRKSQPSENESLSLVRLSRRNKLYDPVTFCLIHEYLNLKAGAGAKYVRELILLMRSANRGNVLDIPKLGGAGRVCSRCGMSRATLYRTLMTLEKADLVQRVRHGVWMISPWMLTTVGKRMTQRLRLIYDKRAGKDALREIDAAANELLGIKPT